MQALLHSVCTIVHMSWICLLSNWICRSARIRTLSTSVDYRKRAWIHEIMAVLSQKSTESRILAPKIRTKCVPNKIFINFSAILYIVYQGDKTIYHCMGQAQIDGFSFFWHSFMIFIVCIQIMWFYPFKWIWAISTGAEYQKCPKNANESRSKTQ